MASKNSKKLDEVKEVIQNKADADILKVLEYSDNNVAKTINAFMKDGGKEALLSWSANKRQQKNTKKNSDVKSNENNQPNPEIAQKISPNNKSQAKKSENSNGSSNVNDLVSSIINQYTAVSPSPVANATPETPSTPQIIPHIQNSSLNTQLEQQQILLNNLNNLIISNNTCNAFGNLKVTVLGIEQPNKQSSVTTSPSSMSATSVTSSTFDNKQLFQPGNTTEQEKNKFSFNNQFNENSYPLISHLNMSYVNSNNTKNNFDKSQKDLQRQSTALAKVSAQFKDELNKSQTNCNQTFMRLRQMLDQRQTQIQNNLNKIAKKGNQLLMQRQNKAASLKMLVDNVVHLNDQDTLELKADIKHFVSERHRDEEFSQVKIFHEENFEQLKNTIFLFGNVANLDIEYATERPPADVVLNNNFSPSFVPSKQENLTNKNNSDLSNNKKNGNKSAKPMPNNDLKANGRFSVKIEETNGFNDANNEGEFIEVKKQRNKKQNKNSVETNGSHETKKEPLKSNGNTVMNGLNGTNGTTKTNGTNDTNVVNGSNQTNGTIGTNGPSLKKKKNKAAVKQPIHKSNINPFSLIANGNMY